MADFVMQKGKIIKPENMAAYLSEQLNVYSTEVQEQIEKAIDQTAKELKADIQNASPERTGKYKKGWRIKKVKSNLFASATVYNKPRYYLVHLLEFGRGAGADRTDGGRYSGMTGRPHVKPAEKSAKERLESRIEDIVGSW
jgi:hypothetical protein